MNLALDESVFAGYHSESQMARVLTENWVSGNMYCPRCGCAHIKQFENNRPVADFFCPECRSEYELKSKCGSLGHKINDGAYGTMIERITSNDNPDFFFISYSKTELLVKDIMIIPKHFFVPDIIEKRKPLSQTARRAGWIGCNILIDKIPEQGRISVVSNGRIVDPSIVVQKVGRSLKLEKSDIESRGWLFDMMNCVNSIPREIFTLDEMYRHEPQLQEKHPINHNIRPKIRQQLQFLRDAGFIEFLGNGKYKKLV